MTDHYQATLSPQVHQPIFGANYISGEYIEQGMEILQICTTHQTVLIGSKHVLTITFNRGGATEFARAFFRITEGG